AEKSIYAYTSSYEINIPGVSDFNLGDALNIVLGEVSVNFENDEAKVNSALKDYLAKYPKLQASYSDNTLWFKGIPAHGSMPWLGLNAGLHLLNFLGTFLDIQLLKNIFSWYEDGKGLAFDGNYTDKYFSETSYNIGRISYADNKLTLACNLRLPAGMNVTGILENVSKKTSSSVILLGGSDGFVSDPESDFIRILMNSYQKETGDITSKPEAIGGGTYARESKNSVAFGAAFQGRDYRMHGNDEYFPIADFYDNMQIYAHAIDDLGEYLRSGKMKF
ncbi:MAG: hypothetical protein WCR67_07285, partial [Bacilli bacterium]